MLTFLDELSPSLGPRSQLVAIRLFYLGTLLQAAHEVIAEPVAVIDSLDGTRAGFLMHCKGTEKKKKKKNTNSTYTRKLVVTSFSLRRGRPRHHRTTIGATGVRRRLAVPRFHQRVGELRFDLCGQREPGEDDKSDPTSESQRLRDNPAVNYEVACECTMERRLYTEEERLSSASSTLEKRQSSGGGGGGQVKEHQ
ncbi:hypothetical protein EYF80_016259 [Liparis tanakae]|uniref:Uncharacterized protein n=1 Tax=Liparis tanakae TaxID=230148 RepID=A0A4Z2I5Z3_9TELE|nr:hypothetical protein EYF80_016259 [Liparis tanakae]